MTTTSISLVLALVPIVFMLSCEAANERRLPLSATISSPLWCKYKEPRYRSPGPRYHVASDADEMAAARARHESDFAVVFHGVHGSGRSSLIQRYAHTARTGTTTTTTTAFVGSLDLPSTRFLRIFMIDTPGFPVINDRRDPTAAKTAVLQGLDQAHDLVFDKNIPLKRIYYALDWTKSSKDPIPDNLQGHLHILMRRYGKATLVRCLKFLVGKYDLVERERTASEIGALQDALARRLATFLERDPGFDRLLYVSSNPDGCRDPGDIMQLSTDLIQAFRVRFDPFSPFLTAVDDYVRFVHDVHDQIAFLIRELRLAHPNPCTCPSDADRRELVIAMGQVTGCKACEAPIIIDLHSASVAWYQMEDVCKAFINQMHGAERERLLNPPIHEQAIAFLFGVRRTVPAVAANFTANTNARPANMSTIQRHIFELRSLWTRGPPDLLQMCGTRPYVPAPNRA